MYQLINELQAVRTYKALEFNYNKTRVINKSVGNVNSEIAHNQRSSTLFKDKSSLQDITSLSDKSLNSTSSVEKNRLSGIYQHGTMI